MGATAPKKVRRRLKKSARRTIAALLLVTALIVAAIPVQDVVAVAPESGVPSGLDDLSANFRAATDPTDASLSVVNNIVEADDVPKCYGYLIDQTTGECVLDDQYHLPIPLYYIDYYKSGYSKDNATLSGYNTSAIYTVSGGVLPFYTKFGFDESAVSDATVGKKGTIFKIVQYTIPIIYEKNEYGTKSDTTRPEGLAPKSSWNKTGEAVNEDGSYTWTYSVNIKYDQFGNKYKEDGTLITGDVEDPTPDKLQFANATSEDVQKYTCGSERQALVKSIADNALAGKTNFV